MLSEASQDEFALLVNGKKRDGYWLELGGGPPEDYSNTYKLETQYNWSGVTIDYNVKYAEMYKDKRPRTIGVFGVNCVSLNYLVLSEMTKLPKHINYLQIDLEVSNDSTMKSLELIEKGLMCNSYEFAAVTFEHDWYAMKNGTTKDRSRALFEKNGYQLIFPDVAVNAFPTRVFEDWYVSAETFNSNPLLYEPIKESQHTYRKSRGPEGKYCIEMMNRTIV